MYIMDTTPPWRKSLNTALRLRGEAALALQELALSQAGNDLEALQITYQRLSQTWFELGQPEKALQFLERAAEQIQKRFGPCHPEWFLNLMLAAEFDPERALEWLALALQIAGRCGGRLHPDRAYLLARRAEVHRDKGDIAAWQCDLEEAEQIWVRRRHFRLDRDYDEASGLVQLALLQAARLQSGNLLRTQLEEQLRDLGREPALFLGATTNNFLERPVGLVPLNFSGKHDGVLVSEAEADDYDLIYLAAHNREELIYWIDNKLVVHTLQANLNLPTDLNRWKQLRAVHTTLRQPVPDAIAGLQLEALSWATTQTALPEEILAMTGLHRLSLRGSSRLRSISGIGTLANLTYLDLSETAIDHLPAELESLRCLANLELGGLNIQRFDANLKHLEVQQSITMEGDFGELPPLGDLSYLRHLTILAPELTELPPLKAPQLRTLLLWTRAPIPSDWEVMPLLEELEVDTQGPDGGSLPLSWSRLTNLRKVHLGAVSLPVDFELARWSRLEELHMQACDDGQLPSGWQCLRSLTEVVCSDVQELPPDGPPNLKVLRLRGRLEHFPEGWMAESLERLELDRNALSQFHFARPAALRDLHLSFNQLQSVQLGPAPELTRIDLTSNQLTSLNLAEIPSLRTLQVNSNRLTDLPVGAALIEIFASRNCLSRLPDELYLLPNLKELFLDGNQLTRLEHFWSPRLAKLSIQNNSLTQPPTVPEYCDVRLAGNPFFTGAYKGGHSTEAEAGLSTEPPP